MAKRLESTILPEEVTPALIEFRTKLRLSGVIGLVFKPDGEIAIVGNCGGVATATQLAAFEITKRVLQSVMEQLGVQVDHENSVEHTGPNHGKPASRC